MSEIIVRFPMPLQETRVYLEQRLNKIYAKQDTLSISPHPLGLRLRYSLKSFSDKLLLKFFLQPDEQFPPYFHLQAHLDQILSSKPRAAVVVCENERHSEITFRDGFDPIKDLECKPLGPSFIHVRDALIYFMRQDGAEIVQVEKKQLAVAQVGDMTGQSVQSEASDSGQLKTNIPLPSVEVMKGFYGDYRPETAKELLEAIPSAYSDYDHLGGEWGPKLITKRVNLHPTTAGRYFRALKRAGVTTYDGIPIPTRVKT